MKSIIIPLILTLMFFTFTQNGNYSFVDLYNEKLQTLDIGGLHNLEYTYNFTLNKNGLNLDTIRINQSQLFGYDIELLDFLKNQISKSQWDYQLILNIDKYHLGRVFYSETIRVNASLYLDGDSADDFSVVNEILDAEKVSSGFVFFQYVFEIHNWLLLVSALVLLIVKTPLNLRYGLIIAIPLLGPGVYLTKETIRLIKARKKKGNKRKAQSKQHPQNATHELES